MSSPLLALGPVRSTGRQGSSGTQMDRGVFVGERVPLLRHRELVSALFYSMGPILYVRVLMSATLARNGRQETGARRGAVLDPAFALGRLMKSLAPGGRRGEVVACVAQIEGVCGDGQDGERLLYSVECRNEMDDFITALPGFRLCCCCTAIWSGSPRALSSIRTFFKFDGSK